MAHPAAAEYVSSAEAVGLRYVTDAMPGIRRKRHGRGFTYTDAEGRVIRDRAMIRRFRGLVIPPAWTDVWICPDPEGHLQVTARDARGRKQYRYHPSFREQRDGTKFERMIALSDVLWKIRERVERIHVHPLEAARHAITLRGRLRHPRFLGLRDDKSARDVRLEATGSAAGAIASGLRCAS